MKLSQFVISLIIAILAVMLIGCTEDTEAEGGRTMAINSEPEPTAKPEPVFQKVKTRDEIATEWMATRIKEITSACQEMGRTQYYNCVMAEFNAVEKETSDLRHMAVYGPKAKTYPKEWVDALKARVVYGMGKDQVYHTCMREADVDEVKRLKCALVERVWIEMHYQDLESGQWAANQTFNAVPVASAQAYEEETGD